MEGWGCSRLGLAPFTARVASKMSFDHFSFKGPYLSLFLSFPRLAQLAAASPGAAVPEAVWHSVDALDGSSSQFAAV